VRLAAVKGWIKSKGVRDFDRVGLETNSLERGAIERFEAITSKFLAERTPEKVKQAIIRHVPRRAILKPSHAEEQLKNQSFELADRVAMVSDRGTVPISAKGVVVGITEKLIDVVFDGPFIGGTTLSNRFVLICCFLCLVPLRHSKGRRLKHVLCFCSIDVRCIEGFR
jgi:5'-3' exoribonuclease 1